MTLISSTEPVTTDATPAVTLATLVIGGDAASREAAIVTALEVTFKATHNATLDVAQSNAIILEGIPSGRSALDEARPNLHVVRIAPGCVCCVGNLTLRVHLNRLLRKKPQRLFIALANSTHLPQVRAFLMQEPYRTLLTLTEEIIISNT